MTTRSCDYSRKLRTFPDHEVYVEKFVSPPDKEPTTYVQAKKWPEWCAAMDAELNALKCNKTCELVFPPPNANVVGCKWVYRIKRN